MLRRLLHWIIGADLSTDSGHALIEERYRSLRRQVPIVYVLGLVNLSALELAATGKLSLGINLPTLVAAFGVVRVWHWFGRGSGERASHEMMVRRMQQTVLCAAAVCLAVCARCIYLLQVGDTASHMAVILFGGLTAVGVAYGLTALPAAARIPLLLILGPISTVALLTHERKLVGAVVGLVTVAALTMRLLAVHSRHFADVIQSRSAIAREQELVEQARQEAVIAATTDFLTGLPNRRAFVDALDLAMAEKRSQFAVAILDLDRFKAVNDTFGHGVGDQLLREVASRLVSAVGERGLVARLGGDELGVLLLGVSRARDAQAVAAKILKGINGPALIDGRQLVVSASCGVAFSRPYQLETPSRLMADADLALYQAKANPGSRVAVFELGMEEPRRRRTHIERALQAPGLYDCLQVVFQPIFDLKSGRIIANEALARWQDAELGEVSPSEFVPIAEQLNLIGEINCWLLGRALRHAREWPDEIKLSFNLSALQICSSGSAKTIIAALKSAGLSPHRLQVEVTETALLADFCRARENLTELKNAGATIVLDDFGAGYASIGYLRELRFDQIKLDGDLVTAAQHSADGKRLLGAVIGLCEVLGVSSVAEHVESDELFKVVQELGCTAGQGFLLSPPMTAADLQNHLRTTPVGELGRKAA